MGKKLKQMIILSKKAIPVAKKAMPVISSVVSSMNLLENASAIVKPIAEDIRGKNSERAKRIDAVQMKKDAQIVIKIEKANIFACAVDEVLAFDLFLKKLNELREKKIINSDIKIQKEQILLIEKLNNIIENGGVLEDYIYRIETEEKIEIKAVEKPKFNFSVPLKKHISFRQRKS